MFKCNNESENSGNSIFSVVVTWSLASMDDGRFRFGSMQLASKQRIHALRSAAFRREKTSMQVIRLEEPETRNQLCGVYGNTTHAMHDILPCFVVMMGRAEIEKMTGVNS